MQYSDIIPHTELDSYKQIEQFLSSTYTYSWQLRVQQQILCSSHSFTNLNFTGFAEVYRSQQNPLGTKTKKGKCASSQTDAGTNLEFLKLTTIIFITISCTVVDTVAALRVRHTTAKTTVGG